MHLRSSPGPARPHPVWTSAVVVAALLLALLPGAVPAYAGSDAGLEARFLDLVDRTRADAGVPPVQRVDDLTGVGRDHAVRMADASHLHHNPALGRDVAGWDKVGENVGRGADLDAIHAAFLDSPSHRANIVDPEWTEAGVGVEVRDGTIWVTQLFRLPTGVAPAVETAPPAEDEPAGEPAADDAPRDDADEAPTEQPVEDAPAPARVDHAVRAVPPPVDRISVVLARLEGDDLDGVAGPPWRSLRVH